MLKIAIVFGGNSVEHEVSVNSAQNVYQNIDKNKYDVSLIYVDKNNNFYDVKDFSLTNKNLITNLYSLKNYDLIFPVMHGDYFEDGSFQGMLDIFKVKYVGNNLLTSSLCMDKVYTKKLLDKENIPNVPYLYIYKNYNLDELNKNISKKIGYPCFIKPSNCGSSVGTSICYEKSTLEKCINEALKYDRKVLIEKFIEGKELEIAILGNEGLIISDIGEIISSDIFYTYDAKYNSNSITKVCNSLDKETIDKIKEYAKEAYKLLECKVLSRIDFFLDKDNNIYLNEINTMPGFTSISMYPMLMKNIGISYTNLINKIIEYSLKK